MELIMAEHYCVSNPEGVEAVWQKIDEKFTRKQELESSITFFEEGMGILPLSTVDVPSDLYDRFISFANNNAGFQRVVIDSDNVNTYTVTGSIYYENGQYHGVVLLGDKGFYQLYAQSVGDQYLIYWELYIVDPTTSEPVEPIETEVIQAMWDDN